MELKKLDKKARTLWLIESLIAVFFILLASILVILFANENAKPILCIALGIPAVLLCVFLIVYPILKYAFYSYGYDDVRIIIKKGVIFKSKVVLPVRQIQDLHVYEGPIMMILGLGGVSVSTAGSSFNIACLNKLQANEMVDALEEHLNDRLGELANEEV